MRLNVTAFLMKQGRSVHDVLDISGRRNHVRFEIDGTLCDFYWKTQTSTPPWVELFADLPGIRTNTMKGKSVQGVLTLERQGRVICFTFGHGRHMISPIDIEKGFGLKVALSLSDPTSVRSIDKTNIDKTPFRSRTQASRDVAISEFDFKFDWEILKSLTGVVISGDDRELVSGTDSVSLHTDVTLAELPGIVDRVLDAYADGVYKQRYPWIDYIVPIRDKHVLERLDEAVVDKINKGEFGDIWIAPPAMIPYENFGGFCYKRVRPRDGSTQPISPELDLENCLNVKRLNGRLTVAQSKASKIHLIDPGDQEIEAWPIYLCLNAEISLDGSKYLLNEGTWYRLDRDFVFEVEQYFDNFEHSNLPLPPHAGKHERPYLEHAAESDDFFLMDQKFIHLEGASSRFEFCDLLTRENHIIHVKKYSSSSVLSHLFSQAFVSAESLVRSLEVVSQVNAYLADMTTHVFEFDNRKQPRPATVVLAIMQARNGNLHMPFFSKVNFKQYSQRLIEMGFAVNLQKIPS